MRVRTASWIGCLLAGSLLLHCDGIRWLGIFRYSRPQRYSSGAFTMLECQRARQEFGFRKRQLRFCKNENFSFAMSAILYAAKAAVYHCGETFADRRWNCSSTRALPRVTADLQRGTREQSFVYAFASAALVYSIGRACFKGEIHNCPCQMAPENKALSNSTYRWGGCHDNMKMAENFVRQFLGVRKKRRASRRPLPRPPYPYGRSKRARQPRRRGHRRRRKKNALRLMNHHNYEAGMRVMDVKRSVTCKCQGVSGSCSTKICFYMLTKLSNQRLTTFLRNNYVKAVWAKKERNRLVPVLTLGRSSMEIQPTELVFIKHSPDYCQRDTEVGSFGTHGRRCNATVNGSYKCENMCCGRGFKEESIYYEDQKCNCRLLQNYVIHCTPCQRRITRHVCK